MDQLYSFTISTTLSSCSDILHVLSTFRRIFFIPVIVFFIGRQLRAPLLERGLTFQMTLYYPSHVGLLVFQFKRLSESTTTSPTLGTL